MRIRGRAVACVLAGLGLAVAAWPGAGHAEVRRLEAVGAIPIGEDGPTGPPRDLAVEQAQREAVSRVANEMVIEAGPTAGSELPDLEQVLGRDVAPYTTRFRILEDRGEGPALFSDQAGATREYVVVVEVHVDADRVRSRLIETGFLAPEADAGGLRTLYLEVQGISVYAAYEDLRELLLTGAGAREVVPAAMERGRMRLRVRTEDDLRAFQAKLLTSAPPELSILALPGSTGDTLRVSITWTPPPGTAVAEGAQRSPAGSRPGAIDTQGRNRY